MSFYEREDRYVQLLTERTLSVKELSDRLFISEPTVRRDILSLNKKGLITCTRGIVKLNITSPDKRIPLFLRELEQTEEKSIMAQKAAAYIKDGDTIMLDASSSVYCIIPLLTKFKNIFVITSGLKATLALSALNIRCVCTGGDIINESFSFVGRDAEELLSRYNADVVFFSCRGLSDSGLITDTSILENSIRRTMIKKSKKKYLLCAGKKIGKTYLSTLCATADIDGVITA